MYSNISQSHERICDCYHLFKRQLIYELNIEQSGQKKKKRKKERKKMDKTYETFKPTVTYVFLCSPALP